MRLLTLGFLTLAAEAASGQAQTVPSMPAEDFSVFLQRVPGLFFFLGVPPLRPAK